MSVYTIQGGRPLHGTLRISGEKNSVLPMIACTLLTSEPCTLCDVPEISDVQYFLETLEAIGARVAWDKNAKTVTVQCADITPEKIERCSQLSKTRANIIMAGALVARFGEVRMPMPGGDTIGVRPLHTHLEGLETFGVEVLQASDCLHLRYARTGLQSPRMMLDEASVTGTETLAVFLAGVAATGEITFAAADPQVQTTLHMLQSMGATVEGIGTHHLRITGSHTLRGGRFTVTPDVTATGTYAIAAAITGGDVTLTNVPHRDLYSFYGVLQRLGVRFTCHEAPTTEENTLRVHGPHDLRAVRVVKPNIYPGLIPDIQSPMAVLLTQCAGTTQLFDWMYEGRLGYLWELKRMGAQVRILNPHQADITGPVQLRGTMVHSWDLRAGASMVLAGLIAEGTTTVTDIHWIDRGYEHFAANLRSLGADIT
ncbi:UDP-N-acetylglucosamine 1-carboxyvinyltransferase [Candidatus Peribacteria bacterium]|nr:UDP-N-acetylglucosamine 1-carboxyvinyltransferase [Candidatus Peribacteria bacterium]